jgi:hypothetical protein
MSKSLMYVALAGSFLFVGRAAAQPANDKIVEPPRLGFVLVAWDDQFNVNPRAWENSVEEVFEAGIRDITVVTYRFVDRTTGKISARSAYGLELPPSDAVVLAALEKGEQLGMRVSLNPLLEIDNRQDIGSQWRGDLDFAGPRLADFFVNYRAYLRDMAQLVKSADADRLYIGSELQSLVTNRKARPFWKEVIQAARLSLPTRVKLSYAANYDSAGEVPFWDELDEIGVDAYFELTTRAEAAGPGKPSLGVIKERWKAPLEEMRKLSNRHERPVVFSEWGVVPFDQTTVRPWDWEPTSKEDFQEQLDAYQATLEVVKPERDWLKGVVFWHWAMPGNEGSHYRIGPDSKIVQSIKQCISRP